MFIITNNSSRFSSTQTNHNCQVNCPLTLKHIPATTPDLKVDYHSWWYPQQSNARGHDRLSVWAQTSMTHKLLPEHHRTQTRIIVHHRHRHITGAPNLRSQPPRIGIITPPPPPLHEVQILTDRITLTVLVLPSLEGKDLGITVPHRIRPSFVIIVNSMIVGHEDILGARHHDAFALNPVLLPLRMLIAPL